MKPSFAFAYRKHISLLLCAVCLAVLCSCASPSPAAVPSTPAPTVSPVLPTSAPSLTPAPTPVPVITADELELFDSAAEHYFGAPDQCYDVADLSDTFSRIAYWNEEYMELTFKKSGKTYLYAHVPLSVFTRFINADSLGGFYNQEFKGNRAYFVDGYEK
ncbi:MAG: KTSC domain-containing protein [Oscillospiraceae bacterium]|nr:KTSC domain-containing protein [Oscillospiraceae bacterium]